MGTLAVALQCRCVDACQTLAVALILQKLANLPSNQGQGEIERLGLADSRYDTADPYSSPGCVEYPVYLFAVLPHNVITYIYGQEPANKACIGRLGLRAFLEPGSELRRFPFPSLFLPSRR